MSAALRPASPPSDWPRSKRAVWGGSPMRDLRRRPDLEVVERDVGFPVVHGQVAVRRAGQRLGVGPRQERLAVDLPVQGAMAVGDGEVVAAAGLDPLVGPLGLAAGAVLFLPADDG